MGLQASLKLTVQDLQGRRREALDPRRMLIGPVSRLAAGGGGVSHPMSQFGLKAQKVYLRLFGEVRSASRAIVPMLPGEVAKQRLLAERPRLAKCKSSAAGSGKSEAVLMQQHAKSLSDAVKRVHEGPEAGNVCGPLGPVELRARKRPRVMEHCAEAADEMYFKMVQHASAGSDATKDEAAVIELGAEAASAAEGRKSLALQNKVVRQKEIVFAAAKPGAPVPYVDAKAGLMRAQEPTPSDPGPPPALPEQCSVLLAAGLKLKVKLDSQKYRRRKDGNYAKATDLVVVPYFPRDCDGPEGLFARLHGSRLVSAAWFEDPAKQHEFLAFRSYMKEGKAVCLYVHSTFESEHPVHTDVLMKATALSPALKDKRPRFEVLKMDLPVHVPRPSSTFMLVGSSYARPADAGADGHPPAKMLWRMKDFLHATTLVYSHETTAASRSSDHAS